MGRSRNVRQTLSQDNFNYSTHLMRITPFDLTAPTKNLHDTYLYNTQVCYGVFFSSFILSVGRIVPLVAEHTNLPVCRLYHLFGYKKNNWRSRFNPPLTQHLLLYSQYVKWPQRCAKRASHWASRSAESDVSCQCLCLFGLYLLRGLSFRYKQVPLIQYQHRDTFLSGDTATEEDDEEMALSETFRLR